MPKSVCTSKGWLIVNYSTFECDFGSEKNHPHCIYLYNPLSRVGIWLPSSSTCPQPMSTFMLSSKPTDPSCIVLALHEFDGNSKFFKFCKPGDEKWTYVLLNSLHIDIIQYKGEFYAVKMDGTFSLLEFTLYPHAKAIPI